MISRGDLRSPENERLPFIKTGEHSSPLRDTIKFIVGANCVRPPLCAICVRFREHQGAPLPVEIKRTEIRSFSGRRGRRPLQWIFIFSVETTIGRPPLCAICVRFREHQGAPLPVEIKRTEIRSFSGGGTPPLQGILRSVCHSERRKPQAVFEVEVLLRE